MSRDNLSRDNQDNLSRDKGQGQQPPIGGCPGLCPLSLKDVPMTELGMKHA